MTFANINHCWGTLIVEELSRLGVDYFCVAPGSRSSPLVIALAQHKKAKSLVHFDERGLGFHAMGYAAATGKPAVLMCTSGTAAANFFPAVIEASKKKLPLIILTADRPPELRQTGAIQTMDQVNLYGKYTPWTFDLPCPDLNIKPEFVLTTVDQAWYQALRHQSVVHINCMFRQPLSMARTGDDFKEYTRSIHQWLKSQEPYTYYPLFAHSRSRAEGPKEAVHLAVLRLERVKSGLIVVGKIGADEGLGILKLAQRLGWPVFADISSGLRLGTKHSHLIHYFDQLLLNEKLTHRLFFDGVLHFGGRITSGRFYEFIQAQKPAEYIMVLQHSLRNDPCHQVTLRLEESVGCFVDNIAGRLKSRRPTRSLKALARANILADKIMRRLLGAEHEAPCSEPAVSSWVSMMIPRGHGLFLANSMPIRDMDSFANFKGRKVFVNGNRGTSGIDGLIASAAGFARGKGSPVTLMIGDLAALHDLNSLALLRDLPVPLIIVVLNNGGGGIFSFLPIADFKEGFEKFWGTPHSFTFANIAASFELNYARPMTFRQFKETYSRALKSRTSTIIEIITTREGNFKLHRRLRDELCHI